MKANMYKLIERCVEDGTTIGLHRAFKYDEHPSDEHIIETIVQCVLQEICEWVNFEEHE